MKKKLLFLINDLSFFISHRLPIAEEALKIGIKVVICYGELGNAKPNFLEKKGFQLISIYMDRGGINFFKDIKTITDIWKIIKTESPDIIHLITIKPYLYGGIISRLVGIKCVVSSVSGLGTLFIKKNFRNIFLKKLLFPVFIFAFNHFNQKIIIQNKDDLDLLVNWGVLKSSKAILIKGSGVDLNNFTNLDEQIGLPVVTFAGRLLKDKGVNEFIDASYTLRKRGIKARFILAGEIDTKNASSISIDDLQKIKDDNYIKILGFVKNIPDLYSKSHIICLPSYREGLPKSLIEAAAASRAIVTTNVPGCRDAIIPNQTGLLVPIKNSKKLADAIQYLIDNPKKRIEMGKYGRKLAEKEFLIKKIVQIHLRVYKDLLN